MNSKEIARMACEALEDKKALEVKIINIEKVSTLADYFIIASGSNRDVYKRQDWLRGTICHLYGGLSDTKGKRKKSALFSERTSDILDRISHHLFRDTGNDRRRVIFVWDFL